MALILSLKSCSFFQCFVETLQILVSPVYLQAKFNLSLVFVVSRTMYVNAILMGNVKVPELTKVFIKVLVPFFFPLLRLHTLVGRPVCFEFLCLSQAVGRTGNCLVPSAMWFDRTFVVSFCYAHECQ